MNTRLLFVTIFLFTAFIGRPVFAGGSVDVGVTLIVQSCNHDNLCESDRGENFAVCPSDCPQTPATSTVSVSPAGVAVQKGMPVAISDVKIIPDFDSAVITWKTNVLSAGSLRLGKTTDYEMSSIEETILSNDHSATIAGLDRNTAYFFELGVSSPFSPEPAYYNGGFSTLKKPASSVPTNVSDFFASFQNQSILLTWTLPPADDVGEIKILRSPKFYSTDPFDGRIVYEGKGNHVFDADLATGTLYYYTAYTRSVSGLYSTGAIIKIQTPDNWGKGAVPIPVETVHKIPGINFSDFMWREDDGVSFSATSSISVSGGSDLSVYIDKDKVPDYIRAVFMSLRDPESGKVYYYMFHLSSDQSSYFSRIGILGGVKNYEIEMHAAGYDKSEYLLGKGEMKIWGAGAAGNIVINLEYLYVLIFVILVALILLILRWLADHFTIKRKFAA